MATPVQLARCTRLRDPELSASRSRPPLPAALAGAAAAVWSGVPPASTKASKMSAASRVHGGSLFRAAGASTRTLSPRARVTCDPDEIGACECDAHTDSRSRRGHARP